MQGAIRHRSAGKSLATRGASCPPSTIDFAEFRVGSPLDALYAARRHEDDETEVGPGRCHVIADLASVDLDLGRRRVDVALPVDHGLDASHCVGDDRIGDTGGDPRATWTAPQQAKAAARVGGACGPTGASGWRSGSPFFLFGFALLEAIAVAVHLEDMVVVSEAIEECAGETLRAEDLGPLIERQVGGD